MARSSSYRMIFLKILPQETSTVPDTSSACPRRFTRCLFNAHFTKTLIIISSQETKQTSIISFDTSQLHCSDNSNQRHPVLLHAKEKKRNFNYLPKPLQHSERGITQAELARIHPLLRTAPITPPGCILRITHVGVSAVFLCRNLRNSSSSSLREIQDI